MATTFKWATPEATVTTLSGGLNSLANATFSGAGTAITNETDLFEYMNLELFLAIQGSARSAGATVDVYIDRSWDAGSTYEDTGNTAFSGQYLYSFSLDASTTARTLIGTNIPIPPLHFKLNVYNNTGQAFNASTNVLSYRRHNEQGV